MTNGYEQNTKMSSQERLSLLNLRFEVTAQANISFGDHSKYINQIEAMESFSFVNVPLKIDNILTSQ